MSMNLYIIRGYSYEESYIIYVSEDKDKCIRLARKLVEKNRKKHKDNLSMRMYWYCVLEAETDKLYYSGIKDIDNMTPQVWDEHDEMIWSKCEGT